MARSDSLGDTVVEVEFAAQLGTQVCGLNFRAHCVTILKLSFTDRLDLEIHTYANSALEPICCKAFSMMCNYCCGSSSPVPNKIVPCA